MSKETLEVEVGSKPTEQIEPKDIGETHQLPEKESGDEVGGRALVRRLMRCWNCGGVSWIWYDTCSYRAYRCCFCGATNVL